MVFWELIQTNGTCRLHAEYVFELMLDALHPEWYWLLSCLLSRRFWYDLQSWDAP